MTPGKRTGGGRTGSAGGGPPRPPARPGGNPENRGPRTDGAGGSRRVSTPTRRNQPRKS
jgi:hypothetical protein